MVDVNSTEKQKQFLEECEREFKDRYTEKDDTFIKLKTMEPIKPPIVDPWYTKSRRSYDWTQQNQNRRNHHWDRHNQEKQERLEKHDRHLHRQRYAPY